MARKQRKEAERVGGDEYDAEVARYFRIIQSYDDKFKEWKGRCDKVIRRYRDEGKQITTQLTSTARMNILWANVNVLAPAMFSVLPKPDVSRRWKDNDPVGRVASLLLERALEYELEQYDDFATTMSKCVMDRILTSRGTSWVRYEPTIEPYQDEYLGAQHAEGEMLSDDVPQEEGATADDTPGGDMQGVSGDEPEPGEQVTHECAPVDFVHWRDFGHNVARTWEEVDVVWRIVYLTKATLIERFGKEVAERIPLGADPNRPDQRQSNTLTGKDSQRAKVYEIWDKAARKVLFISKGVPDKLDETEDPLGLDNFYPCPRPLFGTMTTDSLIPVPDFVLYQDLANELDIITDRIDGLIRALQIKGVYNATYPELQRLFTEASNTDMVPVKDWSGFAASQGLEGAMDLVELEPIYKALEAAYGARKECIDMIYQVTGLGDLMRFDNDPQATATAEKLKGQYGSLKIRSQQKEVVRYATEIIKLKAEILCEKFSDDMLMKIGGASSLMPEDQQLVPQALALLRNNVLRDFRIEVSTDALVQLDENQEKADRIEFLTAVGTALEKMVTSAQQMPQASAVIVELFKFGVMGFKVGKAIEGMLDQAADQLRKNPPQPQPNPEEIKAKAQAQSDQLRAQTDIQIAREEGQVKVQVAEKEAQAKAQSDIAIARAQHEADTQSKQAEFAHKENVRRAELEHEKFLRGADHQHAHNIKDKEISAASADAKLKALTTIVTAEISAQTTLQAGQQQAAQAAAEGEAVEAQRQEDNKKAEQTELKRSEAHGELMKALGDTHKHLAEFGGHIATLAEQAGRPKKVVRDADGKVAGVE